MKKRMVRSCVIMVYAFVLLVSAWCVKKENITKMGQEAFVASILIENTQTGQERMLRAGRDEEQIGYFDLLFQNMYLPL